jgi:hypothetical protein
MADAGSRKGSRHSEVPYWLFVIGLCALIVFRALISGGF